MEALLAAIAKNPELMLVGGLTNLLWALLSTAGNVYQWLDRRKAERAHAEDVKGLNKQINDEIRAGISLGERMADKFTTAAEAYRDAIAAKRGR